MSQFRNENTSLPFDPEQVVLRTCEASGREIIFQGSEADPTEWRWLTTDERSAFDAYRENGGAFKQTVEAGY